MNPHRPLAATLALCAGLAAGCRATGADDTDAAVGERAQAQAHYAAGVLHDLHDEPAPANDEFALATASNPSDEALAVLVARRFLQFKQPARALPLLEPLAKKRDASGSVLVTLAAAYSQLDRNAEASEACRAAVRRAPEEITGHESLYVMLLREKKPDEALAAVDAAEKVQGVAAEFLVTLSELYSTHAARFPTRRADLKAKALAALRRALALNPDDLTQRLKIAEGFYQLDAWDEAASIYRSLPALPDADAHVDEKLANIYMRAGDHDRAVEQLEAIIRATPTDAQAYFYLGSLAAGRKEWSKAVENFNKVVLFNPKFEQAHYELARAQIADDRAPEAVSTLMRAEKRFRENFTAEFLLGVAFSHSKNFSSAVPHFTSAELIAKAGDTNRLTEVFYFQFGAALERSGDFAQAEKCFLRSLEIAPDFAEAQNYLGYMWAERGVKLDEAHALIERALKAEPDNDAFLDSMGWVLFKLDQPQPALDFLLKAVEKSEKPDATLYDHLGDVYAALNQLDKAVAAWRKSVGIEPNENIQRKIGSSKVD